MKLIKAHVRMFKCIKDSEPFHIDDHVTCFVGKNESGKTAILQALTKLNAAEEPLGAFDPLREYPRTLWSEYKVRHEDQPDNVLETLWRLEPQDLDALRQLVGEGFKTSDNTVSVSKGYSNKLS